MLPIASRGEIRAWLIAEARKTSSRAASLMAPDALSTARLANAPRATELHPLKADVQATWSSRPLNSFDDYIQVVSLNVLAGGA